MSYQLNTAPPGWLRASLSPEAALRLPVAGAPALRRRIPLALLQRRGGIRGLGATLEDCTQYGQDLSAGYACAQRNTALMDSPEYYAEHHGGVLPSQVVQSSQYAAQLPAGNWACEGTLCVNTVTGERRSVDAATVSAPVPTSYSSYLTSAPQPRTATPSTGASYSPAVAFQSSRGGSTLYPGDTWTVNISGAAPNAPVTVTGGKNGATPTVSMGTTDASGRFSASGKVSSAEIGTWSESWAVGGQPAGSFTFTVVAGPGGSAANSSSSSAGASSSGGTPPAVVTSSSAAFSFGAVPTWLWIVAAGGIAVWAMKGEGRGR